MALNFQLVKVQDLTLTIELTKILTYVFDSLYAYVEFRKVKPMDYKLVQAANFCVIVWVLLKLRGIFL